MRLAVVSDIHGNLPALQAVLAEILRERVDRSVNLGDIVFGPLWPRETAALLRTQGWPTIRRNHERQLLTVATDRMGPADAFARGTLGEEDLHWLAALLSKPRLHPPTTAFVGERCQLEGRSGSNPRMDERRLTRSQDYAPCLPCTCRSWVSDYAALPNYAVPHY